MSNKYLRYKLVNNLVSETEVESMPSQYTPTRVRTMYPVSLRGSANRASAVLLDKDGKEMILPANTLVNVTEVISGPETTWGKDVNGHYFIISDYEHLYCEFLV